MVLTVALAMTANIVVGHNMARMEQSRRLQFLGASYAEALIKPLWDCDDTAAQAIMNSMLQSRAISGGRLHNACTGSTLASGVLSNGGMSPYVKQLVYDDGAGHSFNVGTLEIEFTPVSIMQRATDSLWEYLVRDHRHDSLSGRGHAADLPPSDQSAAQGLPATH